MWVFNGHQKSDKIYDIYYNIFLKHLLEKDKNKNFEDYTSQSYWKLYKCNIINYITHANVSGD